ncbi:MAG: tRNA(fMet)-specific endonuclease VapC [Verrucomicrobiales bacterium]|jgi:tRNA(fMet)-specific endonuclease VapC
MAHLLLDTSPIIAHLRKKIDLHEILPEGALLFTSLVTIGKLEKGIHRVDNPEAERAKVRSILDHLAILIPGEATAKHYGRISTDLEKRGQRIPENDVWIAAFAVEYKLELVTGDEHFGRVSELNVRLLQW